MKIYTLAGGDEVHRFDRSIVVSFAGKRKVLSTAPYNGGYREDLTAALNHDGNYARGCLVRMKGATYGDHMRLTIRELGLPENTTVGLETAAQMENASIVTRTFRDLTVTAITTGGIEASGGRVGDPASWYEETEKEEKPAIKPGTINTILYINADLYPGTLARALVTATEAKTAALQELMAPSVNSEGIATGSGTDGAIIISNQESDIYLTDAGKFSKLGELIGNAVKESVKEALLRQNGLCPESQHNIMKRMERFGTGEGRIYHTYLQMYRQDKPGDSEAREPDNQVKQVLSRCQFADRLDRLGSSGRWVSFVSLLVHTLDQYEWGLLNEEEARQAINGISSLLGYRQEMESGDTFIHAAIKHFEKMVIDALIRL